MLVARADSIAALRDVLAKASSGHGKIALVRGEPGIGKSALLGAIVREAGDAGAFRVTSGKAWELGEAPPYFPLWSCLRALDLSPPASGADPFRLWEEVLSRLATRAAEAPILWTLEDLHAADVQSLDLLTYLGQAIGSLRVAVIATTRAADPRLDERATQRLVRIARDGLALDLAPLSASDVGAVASSIAGRELTPFEVGQLHELTGGNPLFVVECARAFEAAGAAPRTIAGRTVRAVVADRVNLLPVATRKTLSAAAILGREFAASAIARMEGSFPARVIDALQSAVDAGIVSETRPGHFAFTHIVVRDAIEEMLPGAVRAELHAHAESALPGDAGATGSSGSRDDTTMLVERARHALAALRTDDATIALARRAAAQLEALGAFDRALALHERIEEARPATPPERLHIAHIAFAAGRFATALVHCRGVLADARAQGDAELLAAAALAMGAELRPATVDAELVAALREALTGLEPGATQVRVLARLAAALQPADDPQVPIAMAHTAIAEARALGDDALLLDVLHIGVSAMVDYQTNAIRTPLERELLERALAAGDLTKAIRAQVLYAVDLAAQGDLAGWSAGIDDALELAQRAGHPRHRWRALLLDAMRALAFGDFATADRRVVEVQRLAALTDDPALMLSLGAHGIMAARLIHRDDALRAILPRLGASVGAARHADYIEAALTAGIGARLEDRALTERALRGVTTAPRGFFVDSLNAAIAEGAAFAGTDAFRRALLERWRAQPTAHVMGGVIPLTYEGPIPRIVALLEASVGETKRAVDRLRGALAEVEGRGHRAWIAQLSYDLGVVGGDEAALRRAAELGEDLGMPGLVTRARARLGAKPPPREATRPEARFALTRTGDTWRVENAGNFVQVKDSRGMQMLARLVSRAGDDVHVLVLASDDEGASVHESEAGPAIDDKARRAYKTRLDTLLRDLDVAEANADLGRVAKLQAERTALDAELRRAFGLGGKARPGGASEKARVNVQRRLKDAIARIGEMDPAAGRFLEKAVVTGTYCRFLA